QVAMATSGGVWLAVISSGFLESVANNGSGGVASLRWGVADLGAVLGLAGGAVAAHFHPVSRLRMLLVDLGGLVGGVFGLGVGAAIGFSFPQGPSLYGAMIGATTAAGLVGAWMLTGRIEDEGPAVTLVPIAGPNAAGASIA